MINLLHNKPETKIKIFREISVFFINFHTRKPETMFYMACFHWLRKLLRPIRMLSSRQSLDQKNLN